MGGGGCEASDQAHTPHSHTHSHTRTHTLASHIRTHTLHTLSHTHTHTHSHAHSHTHARTHARDFVGRLARVCGCDSRDRLADGPTFDRKGGAVDSMALVCVFQNNREKTVPYVDTSRRGHKRFKPCATGNPFVLWLCPRHTTK